jgi:hypothetical protein
MAQVKAKSSEEPQAEPRGIVGKEIKFKESVMLDDRTQITYAKAPNQVIKLLPSGWAAIQRNAQTPATLVPSSNINYFIPEK